MSQLNQSLLKPFLTLLFLSAFIAGCGQSDERQPVTADIASKAPVEPVRPSRQYSIEEFIESTSVSGAFFSHDESKILFSSNKSGVWNAYSMPTVGGDWTAITRSDTDNNYAAGYFLTMAVYW